ncbi:MAG: hypothetical protein QOJ60_878 [Actinomycetota bacterium]|nr:hypothetical protein [Actinomycetota bacterium]
MRLWMRDHGLLLANFGLFVVFWFGQLLTGLHVYNQDQLEHHSSTVTLAAYLHTGNLVEATFENWESEFLQMGMYVLLTAYLFQRGSSESKPIDGPAPQDADPRDADQRKSVPWPVRRGGIILAFYERSLSTLFFVLFFASFALHAAGGARDYSENQLAHGQAAVSIWRFMTTSEFWFQSFQNWQSEFLAVSVIVGASVYLRQKGSAESKPVAEPHHATGA